MNKGKQFAICRRTRPKALNFTELLRLAKNGDQAAIETLFEMYKPMMQHEAVIHGAFDEDLYQELCCIFLQCIHAFHI